jgi:hypothetical protein
MSTAPNHPWQRPPLELFQFALRTSKSKNPTDQLVSFLLLDVCVEATLRTFLSLPEGAVESDLKFFDRRKYAAGNFHELTSGVAVSAKNLINDTDLHHAKYYHDVRNQLYHQRTGMTVAPEDVQGYAVVAASLMNTLLGIDLAGVLDERLVTASAPPIDQKSFLELKRELPNDIERFRKLTEQIIEKLEPKLVYPSTISKLSDIAGKTTATSFPQGLRDLRDLIERCVSDIDIRSWFLNFLSDDVEGDSQEVLENSRFIMELGGDHILLYSLIIGLFFVPLDEIGKDSLYKSDDISFIDSDDYSIMGVYSVSCGLLRHFLNQDEIVSGDLGLFERTVEVHKKLKMAIDSLENLVQQSPS